MTTKKTAAVSVVDEMVDDANPPDYPAGTPTLIEYRFLYPRSKRGEFKRLLAKFRRAQEKVNSGVADGLAEDGDKDEELSAEQQEARIELAADADDLFDLMDRLMRMCAADPDEYEAWTRVVEDVVLAKTFSVFMARSQPGEASSSTS
jgi:hypothetical protein